jgi:hypothetical protein
MTDWTAQPLLTILAFDYSFDQGNAKDFSFGAHDYDVTRLNLPVVCDVAVIAVNFRRIVAITCIATVLPNAFDR